MKNNTGNKNIGNANTGNCNFGNYNTGDYNIGDGNAGDWNTGLRNTGDCNVGLCNSGDCNVGHCNSGDFNLVDNSSNVFSTVQEKIKIFDEPTNMTLEEWRDTEAYRILRDNSVLTTWIDSDEMFEEEKEKHPDYKITDGYLKEFTFKEMCENMWNSLTDEEKEIIKNIPNFNAEKFEKITGIKVD